MNRFKRKMKFFSFCSGMDNMGLGFRNADHTQVGWSEINKASILLNSQLDNIGKNYGDMRKISEDPTILPDFDIACAGLPCPAFSIAGKRTTNPFDQKSVGGDLFYHFCKIIKVKEPGFLFLEQVKGVLSAGRWKGEIFSQILSNLSDLGYDAEWQVLNSKNFGLPQNRERLFLVGYIRGTSRPEIFPIMGETNSYTCKSQSAKTAVARTLSAGAHTGGNHSGMTILIYDGKQLRRLTPREFFRLQGTPDSVFDLAKSLGISDTQLFMMAGNSVSVPVVEAIAHKLIY